MSENDNTYKHGRTCYITISDNIGTVKDDAARPDVLGLEIISALGDFVDDNTTEIVNYK